MRVPFRSAEQPSLFSQLSHKLQVGTHIVQQLHQATTQSANIGRASQPSSFAFFERLHMRSASLGVCSRACQFKAEQHVV